MWNFLGKFSYTFSTIILWTTYEQLLTWIYYCVSYQKFGYFGFLFWFNSAFLLSKMKPFFLNLDTSSSCVTSPLQLREVCTNLQIKRFSLMKLWYTIWMHGVSEFQNNKIKVHLPHIYAFWNCLSNHNLALIIAERFTKNSQNSISLLLNITPWCR